MEVTYTMRSPLSLLRFHTVLLRKQIQGSQQPCTCFAQIWGSSANCAHAGNHVSSPAKTLCGFLSCCPFQGRCSLHSDSFQANGMLKKQSKCLLKRVECLECPQDAPHDIQNEETEKFTIFSREKAISEDQPCDPEVTSSRLGFERSHCSCSTL